MDFEPVIGLECHVQLNTQSKIFSGASAAFGAAPNHHVDPYTLGLPGTLPVPNRAAIACAVRMGLFTGCTIRRRSRFARKHYFYPDLPKGYQISQYDEPLCAGGSVDFVCGGERRTVRLIRIHLEEDAGKSAHLPGAAASLLDYNRAGVPLIEIVSAPELRSAEEAAEFLRAVRRLVRYLGISDGNMEEGSLRCDANVSLRPAGSAALGVKTELKNINSFRNVQRAVEHEIARQRDLLLHGGQVVQETRGWDAERGTSQSQRSKEEAHDYRYLPDPDLPPLCIDEAWLAELAGTLPETPMARRDRYQQALRLPAQDAALLSSEPELGDYFDRTLAAGAEKGPEAAKAAANWIGTELLGALGRDGKPITASPVAPEQLAELLALIAEGTISGKIAKDVFLRLYSGAEPAGARPRQIVADRGLAQLSDPAAIEALCQEVINLPAHKKQADKVRAGDPRLLGFFVGQVMARSAGKANPELVNQTLRRLLHDKGQDPTS
jgi:aspartyl-tRNA(Asn)/glutamyl-tRNA(Gln) amidotransferase subunit B